MKASLQLQPMYCSRDYNYSSRFNQQYEKPTQYSMLMYSIYNAETLERFINTVHQIHNTISSHERLFAGQQSSLTLRSIYTNALGLQHYSINSLLYLRTVQVKYISSFKELITQLHICTTAIRILAKGIYLFHSSHHSN